MRAQVLFISHRIIALQAMSGQLLTQSHPGIATLVIYNISRTLNGNLGCKIQSVVGEDTKNTTVVVECKHVKFDSIVRDRLSEASFWMRWTISHAGISAANQLLSVVTSAIRFS
jgi:hypothetical protein